ncbi:HNH endonuclease [Streptomyces longwoodensis]|uniref:HNH endonuclease n=1 Tax=Streptomyces longwoodensis TaxID=68231 RepID=UPI00225A5B15|nr:HNH endonuclease signature motif containing protein [Streptomyces longwoodensis]MCX5001018.1 HNH endonuclease [Streptomyces longwoodensis]
MSVAGSTGMSTRGPGFPLLWALNEAPATDAAERLVLVALAQVALPDGTEAALSKKEIAQVALIDLKTVQRKLGKLLQRGIIAEGDQSIVAHLGSSRPKVYDLLIPCSAFRDLAQVNADRELRSKDPLTQDSRPDLDAAPARTRRSDFGKILGPQRQRSGISEALRQFVYERDGYRCARCGATKDLTLDHVHPWVLGGENSADNLRTLCRSCNSSKNATVENAEVTP